MRRGLRRFVVVAAPLIAAAIAATGCHKAFRVSATQPNPLVRPLETLRESQRLTIVTGDMDLEVPQVVSADVGYGGSILQRRRYPLQNAASFSVVSRDRLRFHVQIEHKWRKYAKIDSWDAYLIDDRGRVYLPEEIDRLQARHVVFMWDQERRTVIRSRGSIVGLSDDGYRDRQPLGSMSLFRGRGDLVFHARDILTPDVRALTLILRKSGVSFEFTWRFAEGVPDTPGTRARTAFHLPRPARSHRRPAAPATARR